MNATKQTKYPQLRFKGFDDPWEQRKLGELGLNISDGNWIEKQHISDNGQYRIIQTGNIGVDEYLDKPQSAKYFHQEDFNQLRANEIFPGDIVVCRLADPAGRAVILPNIGKQMVTSVDVAILRPSSRISFHFLVSQLNSPHNLKQVQVMASGSTRTRISRKNLEKEIIQLPNIEEQKQIGAFFKQLDNLITLHQRKLAKLKELKQGYLQKMFPKNGSKFPQLRFAGFSDAWEQHKLGKTAPLRGGFAFKSSDFRSKGVPIIRISNILSSGKVGGNFIFYDEQNKDDKYILPDKSAVIAMSGATTGKVSILSNPKDDKVYQNQRVGYFQPVKGINYDFISTIVRSEFFMKQLESVLVSGAQPNVSSKEIDLFEFKFPTPNEQCKIGSFFNQLDSLITLHQRKLEHLQLQKKSLLQKMFC